jgi:endonuclease YncB( thermonuclease family)
MATVKAPRATFKIKTDSYTYNAVVLSVVDGDTVKLEVKREFFFEIDFGFHVKDRIAHVKTAQETFRLNGINCPEVTGSTKEAGLKAKEALEQVLGLGPITATTYKPDKYGRWLVDLVVSPPEAEPVNVNQWLIANGFAVPYNP